MKPILPRALGRLRPGELLVHETFQSIQGETTHAGRPCFFIRLAGCHLRCVWCDTKYAYREGKVLTVKDCLRLAAKASSRLVEVTGGEPLLQKSVHALLGGLCDAGFEVLLETSGSLPIDRVDPRVRRIVDWKCPGSGMRRKNDPSVLRALKPGDELKLVIAHRRDYEWARSWVRRARSRIHPGVPVHFSPVFGQLSYRVLAAWIIADGLPVRLGLQAHKWIWGARARGV